MKILCTLSLIFLFSFVPAPDRIQIFLIGDSTLADKSPEVKPETGWGMKLPDFLDDQKVVVRNHAVNGRSTKSFITEGRWEKVLQAMKFGDYVFIQFGHNDQKDKDTTRYGAPFEGYSKNLIKFVKEARAKGANPILLTPVMRRRFDEKGQFYDTHGDYPAAVKKVASDLNVPLIDLHAKSKQVLESKGEEGSKALFLHLAPELYPHFKKGKVDDTHFSEYGAEVMASEVADGILETVPALIPFLKHFGATDRYAFQLPIIQKPYFKADTFNIVNYGAKKDGIKLNTNAIKRAIEACGKNGGGVVLIPEGFWLTGPIVLESHINLHLAKGALLQFSDQYDDYPVVKTSFEGVDAIRCQSPISAENLENVAITGFGIVDGAGQVWRAVKREKLTDSQWKRLVDSGGIVSADKKLWYPSEKYLKGENTKGAGNIAAGFTVDNVASLKDFLRPNMIRFTNCKRILLEGVTFQNSPAWNLHPMLCEHITVKNITVRNPWYAQNGDGIDIESCRFGIVDNCTFDVGDDGICIKSGRDEEGRKRGVPTENIIVQNATVFHGHGGFVIGSEMSGGVKNIFINNCNFLGTDVGLRFKTARGRGGVVEDIFVSNINMTNIPGEAILFDMYYQAKDPVPQAGKIYAMPAMTKEPLGEGTPVFRNFSIRNVVCKGAETGILIRGLPEMSIKNITIENSFIQSNKGLICVEAEYVKLKNVTLLTKQKTAMYILNSSNITLDHITYGKEVEVPVKVEGKSSASINLTNTSKSITGKLIEY